MLIRQLVKDHFGQKYKIQTRTDTSVHDRVKPEQFYSEIQASRFIGNLVVPVGFWKNLYYSTALSEKPARNDSEITAHIATLFISGKIKAYKVDISSHTDHPPSKRTITDGKKNRHIFLPASALLISKSSDVITFNSKAEAHKYLAALSPDKASLQTMVHELKLPRPKNKDDHNELMEIIATGMASGDVVITVDNFSSPPAPSETSIEPSQSTAVKSVGLGPAAAASSNATPVEKKEHVCSLSKMTLSCKHGREAILDPAAPLDKKTGIAKAPYLAVTSAPQSSDRAAQELITAKITVDDKCPSHTQAPYSISSDTISLVGENFGDIIKFYSPGEELDLATKFYKYIWLPSIKPISYKVYPPTFCDMSKFDGKAQSTRVDVYPEISWDIGLEIGFGQITAADESPSDNTASKNNVIERKIDQEVFSITGKAKCTNGSNTIDYVADFKNKFGTLEQEITNQNALLSKVFGKFQEGDNHSVTIDLPKLAFNGTSSIAEKNGSPDVDIKWDYNIKAAPLIGIKAEVDVLPMLIRSSGWGSLFLPLLRELKEKYANPDGSIGVQLEASIILSIEGKVEFDLSFTDATFVHDDKTELRSLKFDVPFECKGELKGKGHILVFSAELGVLAKLNSGFAYEMLMGADSAGIYRSSILHFHGLVFEIKAYIEGKAEYQRKPENKGIKLKGKYGEVTAKAKKRKEYSNKWTWIEKDEIEFGKEYIVSNG